MNVNKDVYLLSHLKRFQNSAFLMKRGNSKSINKKNSKIMLFPFSSLFFVLPFTLQEKSLEIVGHIVQKNNNIYRSSASGWMPMMRGGKFSVVFFCVKISTPHMKPQSLNMVQLPSSANIIYILLALFNI